MKSNDDIYFLNEWMNEQTNKWTNKQFDENLKSNDNILFLKMLWIMYLIDWLIEWMNGWLIDWFQAQVLSVLSHRNIIKFYGAVTEEPNYCLITGMVHLMVKHHQYPSLFSGERWPWSPWP